MTDPEVESDEDRYEDLSHRTVAMMKSEELGKILEWKKWTTEIPFLSFPDVWEVKAVPPFLGSIIRYNIRLKQYPDNVISIYLDGYDVLGSLTWGIVPEPYYEIYPSQFGDVERIDMNNTETLMHSIWMALIKANNLSLEESVKLLPTGAPVNME